VKWKAIRRRRIEQARSYWLPENFLTHRPVVDPPGRPSISGKVISRARNLSWGHCDERNPEEDKAKSEV